MLQQKLAASGSGRVFVRKHGKRVCAVAGCLSVKRAGRSRRLPVSCKATAAGLAAVHGPSFESLDSDDLLSPLATGVSDGKRRKYLVSENTDQQVHVYPTQGSISQSKSDALPFAAMYCFRLCVTAALHMLLFVDETTAAEEQ